MILRIGIIAIFGSVMSVTALAQNVEEYRVKAVFIYNFTKFIEWPPQSFKSPAQPISICILGKNPFGEALEKVLRDKTVQDRALVIRPETSDCHVLFIAPSEWKRARPVFLAEGCGVLTVGDTGPFASQGGIINFKIENGTVRIQINPEAAARKQLRISSKLLGLPEIVK